MLLLDDVDRADAIISRDDSLLDPDDLAVLLSEFNISREFLRLLPANNSTSDSFRSNPWAFVLSI